MFETVLDVSLVKKVQLQLRHDAVVMCCMQGNKALAWEVFKRQWNRWHSDSELKVKNKLEAILNGAKEPQLPSMDKLVLMCCSILETIFEDRKEPFLIQAAVAIGPKVISTSGQNFCSQPDTSGSDLASALNSNNLPSEPSTIAGSAVKHCAHTVVSTTDSGSPDKRLKLAQSRSLEKQSKCVSMSPSVVKASLPGTSLTKAQASPKKSGSMVATDVKVSETDSISDDFDSSELELDSDPSFRLTELKSKHGRGARKNWSTLEEELVYRGIQKYGTGNWAAVSQNYLPRRSNVDIKDKWRTMTRQGRLPLLAKQFGPLRKN
jgi:hypothetical protein